MKLFMLTQQLDPNASVLGFMWGWVNELAKHCETLYVSAYDFAETDQLPQNVKCYRFSYAMLPLTWLRLIYLKLFKGLDAVFVHMCPMFLVSVAPVCKLLGLPLVLWYNHEYTDFKLKVVCWLSTRVFSAYDEGCRPAGDKLVVIGGVGVYVPPSTAERSDNLILSVSRISRSKRLSTIIETMPQVPNARLEIVGEIYDYQYLAELKQLASDLGVADRVTFIGKVGFRNIGEYYRRATVFVDAQKINMNKTVLEAMICGTPVLVMSSAYNNILGSFRDFCQYANSEELAMRLNRLLTLKGEGEKIGRILQERVEKEYGLEPFINRMTSELEKLKASA